MSRTVAGLCLAVVVAAGATTWISAQRDVAIAEVKRLRAVNEALSGAHGAATAIGAAYLELLHARGCPVGGDE